MFIVREPVSERRLHTLGANVAHRLPKPLEMFLGLLGIAGLSSTAKALQASRWIVGVEGPDRSLSVVGEVSNELVDDYCLQSCGSSFVLLTQMLEVFSSCLGRHESDLRKIIVILVDYNFFRPRRLLQVKSYTSRFTRQISFGNSSSELIRSPTR